jgi:tetratricopeptide (TPR) repeat protein
MRRTAVKWVVCIALLAAVPAAASPDRGRARERYQQAIKHYNLTEYREALEAFKDAYREVSEPSLLFNIAQCYRQLDDKAQALRFYRNFLREIPDASNRLEVRSLIQKLEAAQAEESRARSSPPTGTLEVEAKPPAPSPEPMAVPPPPEPVRQIVARQNDAQRGRAKIVAGATVAAAGLAALAAGVAFGVLAKNAGDELTRLDQTQGNFDKAKENAGRLDQTLEGALLGVGAAAVIAGVVTAAVGARERRHRPTLAGGPGLVGVSLKVGF